VYLLVLAAITLVTSGEYVTLVFHFMVVIIILTEHITVADLFTVIFLLIEL